MNARDGQTITEKTMDKIASVQVKQQNQPDLTPEQKRFIEYAAKKIVTEYGKTLQLLAEE